MQHQEILQIFYSEYDLDDRWNVRINLFHDYKIVKNHLNVLQQSHFYLYREVFDLVTENNHISKINNIKILPCEFKIYNTRVININVILTCLEQEL